MQKFKLTLLLGFGLIGFAYYGWLRIDNAKAIREPRSFGDTGDYFHNAKLPVLSGEFWTDARPPVTALFWKLVRADPERIFGLQLYFSIASWGVLAFVIASQVTTDLLKPLVFAVILAFSLS